MSVLGSCTEEEIPWNERSCVIDSIAFSFTHFFFFFFVIFSFSFFVLHFIFCLRSREGFLPTFFFVVGEVIKL